MQFDFDKINNRRGLNGLKWNVAENELPMWVADMDFQTAPAIREAVEKKAATGIFGYSTIPESWYEAIQSWWQNRHSLLIKREWLTFCSGVVPAISSIVRSMTNPGDSVAVMTPVYDIFFHSIENNGRHVLECPLLYENHTYSIDYEVLEEKLAEPLTTMLLLCNPQNPGGIIWKKTELERIAKLCRKNHVLVVSDEIHCDLTLPGTQYVPFISVSPENSITCLSPSKAFNVAGFQSAATVIPEEAIRQKVARGLNNDEIAEPNIFAIEVAQTAYTQAGSWLDALRAYLADNRRVVREFLRRELPQVSLCEGEATYLLWLDVSRLTEDSATLQKKIRRETGLYLSDGSVYRGDGKKFLRMNIACPRAVLLDGLERLKRGIE